MKTLTLDLETIPAQNLPPESIPQFDPDSIKLGNLKDPDKVAAKIAEEKAAFERDLTKKMSTDPDLCQIVSCAMNDQCIIAPDLEAEYELLGQVWTKILHNYNEKGLLITFNGAQFDLRILYHRAIYQDIPINVDMYRELTRRYGSRRHFDIMQEMARWDIRNWKSLDFYLKRFGLGGKGDMDGSMVYPLFKAGEFDKIKEYNLSDVRNTQALFERIKYWFVEEQEEDPI